MASTDTNPGAGSPGRRSAHVPLSPGGIRKRFGAWRVGRALSRLAARGGCESLARALEETWAGEFAPDERAWIERLEAFRAALRASEQEVAMVNYGAVRDADLNEEEMLRGRLQHRTVGEVCRSTASGQPWTSLLFKLIRNYRPATCLELGTSLGVSGSFQAAALALNGSGKLVTLEGAETIAALAEAHFASLGLTNVEVVVGRFDQTLDGVLSANGPVGCAYIDGHHDERATLDYFERVAGRAAAPAVLAFDDVDWSDGMRRAWAAIERDARVGVSVNLGRIGVCLLDGRTSGKVTMDIPAWHDTGAYVRRQAS